MSERDWKEKFPQMTPISSPPPLFRFNGCGVGIYGSRDHDPETQSYVKTLCLSLVFIPVFCLRGYRVARAPRGWYFIGREPLSMLAKGWNVLLVLAIGLWIGGYKYHEYLTSPAHVAKLRMDEARTLASSGKVGDAAEIYQSLIMADRDESSNATGAMKDLIETRCQSAPLSESAHAFAIATVLARSGKTMTLSDLAQKGLKLATEKGDSDPRGGIALLDTIRPLMIDTRPVDERRLPLLRKLAAAEPGNLDIIAPLASILEQQGQAAEAKKLLLPFKDKLNDGEGARVLGTILGREGDYDASYNLLWPYVKARLGKLHAAKKADDDVVKRAWDREIALLRGDKGPADFYERYKSASESEKQAIVDDYVNGRLKNDPELMSSQETLRHEAAVVPVALELGMIMLQRAQSQSDAAARKAQLQSTEEVFLAVGGVAGESEAYRLSLGQVYYWLGKQAEGRKLFDDYLAAKGRKFSDLCAIARILRELGAQSEARAMAEEAYNKASQPNERHGAALMRALCHRDLDDQIEWLGKCDLADAATKAELAQARGSKAFEQGNDDEAARQYRVCIDAYSAMPRSAGTLNETAIAYSTLFRVTGEHQAMERCLDYFQQAVELSPTDSILLQNAGATLLDSALADVIGNDIDLRALHQTGDLSLLSALYHDQATRDAIAKRVKDHPGVKRAIAYLQKVMVLAPRNASAFATVFSVYHFTRDNEALRALARQIQGAGFDVSDELAAMKEFREGVKDAQRQAAAVASVKRSEDLAASLRPKGGATAAVAIVQQVGQILNLEQYTGTADAARIIQLAEEARRLAPSAMTSSFAIQAYLFRAAQELRQSDSAFNAFYRKYSRSIPFSYLMACAAREPSSFQQKVLHHADVQKVIEEIREEFRHFPNNRSTYEWALLVNADAAEAERTAEVIRKDPRYLTAQSISAILSPESAGDALETYWLMQIHNKPDEARAAIRRVKELGIPMPIGN